MKLAQLVTDYIAFKHALGVRFQTEATILKAFSRAMGDIDIAKVQASAVQTFLAGNGVWRLIWSWPGVFSIWPSLAGRPRMCLVRFFLKRPNRRR